MKPRRSNRRRVHVSRVKKWAERSVWSFVCAAELGLVVAPLLPVAETSFSLSGKRKGQMRNRPKGAKYEKHLKDMKNWKLRDKTLRPFPRSYLTFESVAKSSEKSSTIKECWKNYAHDPNCTTAAMIPNLDEESTSDEKDDLCADSGICELQNLDIGENSSDRKTFYNRSLSREREGDVESTLSVSSGTLTANSWEDSIERKKPKEKKTRRYEKNHGKKKTKFRKEKRIEKNRRNNSKTLDLCDDNSNSDIDESLIVDPSIDLPGSLQFEPLSTSLDVAFTQNETLAESLDVSSGYDDGIDGLLKESLEVEKDRPKETESVKKSSIKTRLRSEKKRRGQGGNGEKGKKTKKEDPKSALEPVSVNQYTPNIESHGRVTRASTKNVFSSQKEKEEATRGTIVWGNCMGWWPAMIIDAEDVGMPSEEGKNWVCWLGEYRISNLRVHTQIQPFSTKLKERFLEVLGRPKSTKTHDYVVCMSTLRLINEEILDSGPLSKPYDVWAERHLIGQPEVRIDQLIIDPYPPHIQQKLDEWRKKNIGPTEKYLAEIEEERLKNAEKSKLNSDSKKGSKNRRESVDTFVEPPPGHLPLIDQKPGVIAWAKIMGQIWWPGVIIDFRDFSIKQPAYGCQWIIWYGDATLSEVSHNCVITFEAGISRMKDYTLNCKRRVFTEGVLEAAKDYCSRSGYKTDGWTLTDVFDWFDSAETTDDELPGIPGNSEITEKYPFGIISVFREHSRGECSVVAAREHAINQNSRLLTTLEKDLAELQFCLMCLEDQQLTDTSSSSESIDHPFFHGKLCEDCAWKYEPTIFAYGDDGKCFFCTVCAGSDVLVVCDSEDCPRVFCTACIKHLIAPKAYERIMRTDPWYCFVCDPWDSTIEGGLLKPRENWREQVSAMIQSDSQSLETPITPADPSCKQDKSAVRVLSLFDGIAAGLVALEQLGIEVEVYYASEIDPDAEMVSSAHFGDKILRLGDVRSIDEKILREIGPIDLLIGGSPCNDLSLVNPARLGLHDSNGTGVLVFEYCRIKKILESIAETSRLSHFFWLFENVASMPTEFRHEISKHMGRQPYLIDAANYSPQHRPRLYWGNLPKVFAPISSQDLQDVLTPNCNRFALVKKIRTVTTRPNSLKQGKEALKPILMKTTNDTLWITELEQIFGFPKHYTDVKNLCATKRQKLIGMSWSVQTIVQIMRPLCNFFRCHPRCDSDPRK